MKKPQISVLILTLNEEINILDCIKSVQWADDIVVLDSFSNDSTVELAQAVGARVIQRKFDNWASHQNWALANIDFKYEWVFYIDADERCDEQLLMELMRFDGSNPKLVGYEIRRKDYFMGRWLKHAQLYPVWLTRLFRKDKMRYERLVNPVAKPQGAIGRLNGHIIHHPFSHGLDHWFARHNNYSSFEAAERVNAVCRSWSDIIFDKSIGCKTKVKQISYKLPLRPLIMYCYLMFFRLAFLDGVAGLRYVRLRVIYEYMIDIKYAQLLQEE